MELRAHARDSAQRAPGERRYLEEPHGAQGGAELPQFRDFLARLRPAGAPGAASRVGVAADRVRERSAELEPVLAMLAGAQAECAAIVAEARRDARRIAEKAQEQAAMASAEARRRAEAARAEAVAEVLAAARQQAARAARGATPRVRQPDDVTEQRIEELVSAAVEMVRRLPGEGRLP